MSNNQISVRKEKIITFAKYFPGAEVIFRTDWMADYFSVFGKMFALMGELPSGEAILTIKGLPENNEQLRDQYTDILPGYYANKTHWISIKLATTEISDQEIQRMLQQSYQLIVNKLTKKDQEKLKMCTND